MTAPAFSDGKGRSGGVASPLNTLLFCHTSADRDDHAHVNSPKRSRCGSTRVPTVRTPRRWVAAIGAWAGLAAPWVMAQPLNDELAGLLSQNPRILAAQAELESTREGIDAAFSSYLPQVDARGTVGPTSIETDTRNALGLGRFNETQQTLDLTVTQNVFDGFETAAEVRIARLDTEVARQTLAGTRQTVLLDGAIAYLDVLRQQRLVELALLSEESIKLQAELEDERVVRGGGIAVDVLQAKSRLQIAKERRVAFEGALQNAMSRYIQVFGHAPVLEEMGDPTPPEAALPRSIDQAIDVAEAENPAISSSLATVEAASERRRLARAGYFPRLEIVGTAAYEKDFDLQPGERNEYTLVLQATWNLFNGFRTSANVSQAAYDFHASQENHTFVNRTVVETTRLAWQELKTAEDRLDLLANAVVIAEEVFDARRALRELGRETVINVLISEDEVNVARISHADARYARLIAVYRILQAIGRLDPDTLGLRLE